jgi:hypothetical protein
VILIRSVRELLLKRFKDEGIIMGMYLLYVDSAFH